jgi:hypothetical protein
MKQPRRIPPLTWALFLALFVLHVLVAYRHLSN